jgi:hypothetical protein
MAWAVMTLTLCTAALVTYSCAEWPSKVHQHVTAVGLPSLGQPGRPSSLGFCPEGPVLCHPAAPFRSLITHGPSCRTWPCARDGSQPRASAVRVSRRSGCAWLWVSVALAFAVGAFAATVFAGRFGTSWTGQNLLTPGRVCSAVAVAQVREPGAQSVADAPLAQSAERLHGKEKVYGSIP